MKGVEWEISLTDKNNKSIKWYINSILIFFICCTAIISIVLMIASSYSKDNIYCIWALAIYSILGICAIPNIIMKVVKEGKVSELEFDSRKAFFDKYHVAADNSEKYYRMILVKIIREVIISSISITFVVLFLLYICGNWYINDGPSHLNNRPVMLKIFRSSTKVEGGIFLETIFLIVFGIPIIVYAIVANIHKIILFKKKKYYCYKVEVENIGLRDNLYVKSLKNLDSKGVKFNKKHKKNEFQNYKCIGINKKDIINKEVILILTAGKVYLLNE